MSVNLLDLLKGQISDKVIGQIAGLTNESASTTSSAMGAILPSILGGIVSKGATDSGAGSLLKMITDQKMDGSLFNNLSGMLGGGSASNGFMEAGKGILGAVLGSNQSTFLNLIMKATGLSKGSSSSMMSLAAPMVMNMIGKQVMKNGLNAGGLMKLLSGQKSFLSSALPAGMGNLLGFGSSGGSSSSSSQSTTSNNQSSGGGGGFLKWILLGLAGLLALGYFGMRTGCGAVDNAAATVTDKTGQMVDASGNAIKSMAGYTKDAAGNLVDESGKIVRKAGEFTMDAAGNVVDAAGNALEKTGEMAGNAVDAAGNAIKSIAGYTKDAAGNLVDESGKIIHKAGEFTVDAAGNVMDAGGKVLEKAGTAVGDAKDAVVETIAYKLDGTGNLVDNSGKIVLKVGEFEEKDGYYVDKKGNRIGKAFAKVKEAVGAAAGKTADFFKSSFSDMFEKKSKTGYALSDIEWSKDGHRITNFSKAEVEGLATALKNHPEAKINVNAYTNDGGNSVKNKSLSKLRAEVVMNMLTALGVDKKQISSKGMSDKDAGKAAANAIEVLVAE